MPPVVTAPPRRNVDVAETLGLVDAPASRGRGVWRVARWSIPAVVAAVGIVWVRACGGPESIAYDTAEVRRGDLVVTVTATGTLAPLDTVYVGTEVSGVVDSVAADYNDHVRKGQLLAIVNTDQMRAQMLQAAAALRSAAAAAEQAAATLTEVRGYAVRAEALAASGVLTAQELEAARASLARAIAADVAARAQIEAADAGLAAHRTALGKATIRAPIDGIVLQRQVEPGRTVAAAFQAPVLFVLAADLAQMTLGLDIDEADVGQVRAGQDAEFTVDAFPERSFRARVRSVRNAAKIVEGVVTYQAVLDVANPDLALRPGMTATARVTTAQARDALLVPNAALRFSPDADSTADSSRAGRSGTRAPRAASASRVWLLRDGQPVAVAVTTGLSNGQWTAVTSAAIEPGTPVVVGRRGEPASSSGSGASSPQPVLFPRPIRAR